jgi:hypothetical protein
VCGDCDGGPWLRDERLGVLTCEGCDEVLALFEALPPSGRLSFWGVVGLLQSERVLSAAEWGEERHECAVCTLALGAGVPYGVYRKNGVTVSRVCLGCGQCVRYAHWLGPLRAELSKAYVRRISQPERP